MFCLLPYQSPSQPQIYYTRITALRAYARRGPLVFFIMLEIEALLGRADPREIRIVQILHCLHIQLNISPNFITFFAILTVCFDFQDSIFSKTENLLDGGPLQLAQN